MLFVINTELEWIKGLCTNVGVIVLIQGCFGETVKRKSFEVLQNLREQPCRKDLSGKCPSRESVAD